MRTILRLILSNAFMTAAWYGHLKFKSAPLAAAIAVSWLIALPEYALQVPANRWGHGQFTAPQLKIIQEVVSITVFILFSAAYLKELPRWNDWLAFVLIFAAVVVSIAFRRPEEPAAATAPAHSSTPLGEEGSG